MKIATVMQDKLKKMMEVLATLALTVRGIRMWNTSVVCSTYLFDTDRAFYPSCVARLYIDS